MEIPDLQSAGTEGRVLIVYFSRWGNTDYPEDIDAMASASIVADGDALCGTTEYGARRPASCIPEMWSTFPQR